MAQSRFEYDAATRSYRTVITPSSGQSSTQALREYNQSQPQPSQPYSPPTPSIGSTGRPGEEGYQMVRFYNPERKTWSYSTVGKVPEGSFAEMPGQPGKYVSQQGGRQRIIDTSLEGMGAERTVERQASQPAEATPRTVDSRFQPRTIAGAYARATGDYITSNLMSPKARINPIQNVIYERGQEYNVTFKEERTIPKSQVEVPGFLSSQADFIQGWQTAQEKRSQRAEDLFKSAPGLGGESWVQTRGRLLLAAPAQIALGLPEQLGLATAKTAFFLQATALPKTRGIALSEIGRAGSATPKAFVQSIDPRTPSGFVNDLLILGLAGMKAVKPSETFKGITVFDTKLPVGESKVRIISVGLNEGPKPKTLFTYVSEKLPKVEGEKVDSRGGIETVRNAKGEFEYREIKTKPTPTTKTSFAFGARSSLVYDIQNLKDQVTNIQSPVTAEVMSKVFNTPKNELTRIKAANTLASRLGKEPGLKVKDVVFQTEWMKNPKESSAILEYTAYKYGGKFKGSGTFIRNAEGNRLIAADIDTSFSKLTEGQIRKDVIPFAYENLKNIGEDVRISENKLSLENFAGEKVYEPLPGRGKITGETAPDRTYGFNIGSEKSVSFGRTKATLAGTELKANMAASLNFRGPDIKAEGPTEFAQGGVLPKIKRAKDIPKFEEWASGLTQIKKMKGMDVKVEEAAIKQFKESYSPKQRAWIDSFKEERRPKVTIEKNFEPKTFSSKQLVATTAALSPRSNIKTSFPKSPTTGRQLSVFAPSPRISTSPLPLGSPRASPRSPQITSPKIVSPSPRSPSIKSPQSPRSPSPMSPISPGLPSPYIPSPPPPPPPPSIVGGGIPGFGFFSWKFASPLKKTSKKGFYTPDLSSVLLNEKAVSLKGGRRSFLAQAGVLARPRVKL